VRRAALDGCRRVVQFVREPGGEPSERRHFLVLQPARGEDAAAIQHLVNQHRRDFVALANHRRHVFARDGKDLGRLLCNRVAGRRRHARVGKHTRHVSCPPLHHLVPTGTSVDIDRDVSFQHDKKVADGHAFLAQDLTLVDMPQRAM